MLTEVAYRFGIGLPSLVVRSFVWLLPLDLLPLLLPIVLTNDEAVDCFRSLGMVSSISVVTPEMSLTSCLIVID
jgi:hypothetical protein